MDSSRAKKRTTDRSNRVEELAKKKGLSMAQLSIAWILSKEGKIACYFRDTPSLNVIQA